eukprot:Protomagalhaensia_sp_Gyna_25__2302@NODE_2261_length_1186_cov_33_776809_g1875_i0_p2_GENE_NODE_2261_length_1186_cov_33_776809_g1875_i0NODE_2261_length_1186_cov_33_776809_g1875_i0_p2_ORF_typecomplete_len196_score20_50zfCCHC_3/PF13917_6/7_9e03zfCCHC_3/PF13917_6/3_2e10zfCCHC_3/PF13917_6/8_2e03zfCCHC_6/PF15288_6/0_084zfCCHC_6/PF15288_6/1_1e03zfCCHC_4/PF14392_6/0_25_NODE_2261_length_1186_cov_33_776809_g1875_i0223810
MPATAGRIRMPANNRVSVSDSLKLSEIWQKSVGYDPYAPQDPNAEPQPVARRPLGEDRPRLVALGGSLTTPGACKRCHQVGHMTYQCRNEPKPPPQEDKETVEDRSDVLSGPLTGANAAPVAAQRRTSDYLSASEKVILYKGRGEGAKSAPCSSRREQCPQKHHHHIKKKYLRLLEDPQLDSELRRVLERVAKKQ